MSGFLDAFGQALSLLVSFDPDLLEIVALSLEVSLSALVLACGVGLPLGAVVAVSRFRGRRVLIVLLNASMGLPPVVIGLVVYQLLSRSGPLGGLGWLFTPKAMVMAQLLLITPLVAALTRQAVADLWEEYEEQLRSLGVGFAGRVGTLLWEGRFRLITTLLAGFGRAIAEVGAVIIVGGNIAHQTRVMTTAIALETSRGDLALALGLGIVLLLLSLTVNAAAALTGEIAAKADA